MTLFVLVIVVGVVAYTVGRQSGANDRYLRIAEEIRTEIQKRQVEPWLSSFKKQYVQIKDGRESYHVNKETLRSCYDLAKRLNEIRQLFPESDFMDQQLRKRVHSTFGEYVTSCHRPGDFAGVGGIDPYFGSPLGYVDAFLQMLESEQSLAGVWLNPTTGDLALQPRGEQNYDFIVLE